MVIMMNSEIMNTKMMNLIKFTFIASTLLLAYSALSSAASADTNLVANPSFESGSSTPLNWTFVTYSGNTPYWDAVNHSGVRSVRMQVSGTIDSISGYPRSDLISAQPLANYTFSAWVKAYNAGGTNSPAVRVVELDANKNWIRQINLIFSKGTNDWTQKQIDFQTGSNTAYLYVYANIWNSYGTFWVDDVVLSLKTSLTPIPTPTPTPTPTPAPDTTPPSIAIYSPTNGQTFTSPTITVNGTASDDIGLSNVEVRVGSGTWVTASGTSSWNTSVNLSSGSNTIYARATDASGNIKETSITVTYNSAQSNLTANWNFNEGTGTIASDSSGNANNGMINGATWTTGKFGSALQFDGVNSYVNVPDSNSLDASTFTFESWIKNNIDDSNILYNRVASKKINWYDADGWTIEINGINSGGAGEITVLGSGRSYNSVQVLPAWDQNWHHLAIVFSGSTAFVYFDGVYKGVSNINNIVSNNVSISIGRLGAGSNFFNGIIDEAKIYNQALSAEEIMAEYQAGTRTSDITPPSIAINSHINGQAFTTSTITVNGTASDDIGLSKVEVKVGTGAWQLASGTASWSTTVNLVSGSNTITMRATDTSGNFKETSVTVIYTLSTDTTPPSIIISSPTSSQTFTTSTITVSGTASDNVALSKVEVKVGSGTWQLASGTTSWNTTVNLASGSNTIYARAIDASGNIKETSITVTYNSAQSDLIAYWNFNESTGTIASDSSGNANNGIINGATWTTGKLGSALQFDGVNDYVNVPDSNSLDASTFTFESWIKNNINDSNILHNRIASKKINWDDTDGWSIEINGINSGGAGEITVLGSGRSFNRIQVLPAWDKNWHHLVVVFSGSTAFIYLDGVYKGVSNINNVVSNNVSISIGRLGAGSNFFNGIIDEVKIYNQALSAEEIMAEYQAGTRTSDITPPSIAINSPTNGQAFTTSTITVNGTASDNVGLSKVEVKVGNGTWVTASGTASWSTTVNLASGSNTITARATDASGNLKESSIIVTYSTTSSGISSGKTYYVAKNGNDANPGTETQPWLTIQKAANTLVAGDTVYIKTGTYYERVVPAHSGTAGNYITYAAYPGHTPIIDGQDINIVTNLMHITNKAYIIVQGLTFKNNVPAGKGGGWGSGHGIYVRGSHHIKLLNDTTDRTGSSGIMTMSYAANQQYIEGNEDLVIDGCIIKDANTALDSVPGYPLMSWQEALDLVGVSNFVVRNNVVLGGWKEHMDMKSDDNGITTGFGRIYGNFIDGTYITVPPTGFYQTNGNVGIYQDGAHDVNIYNNRIINVPIGIGVGTEGSRVSYNQNIFNNILYSNSIGIRLLTFSSSPVAKKHIGIYNNIFYGNTYGVLWDSDSPCTTNDCWIRNNIATSNSNPIVIGVSGVTSDHNLVSGDPKYINPPTDFHYQSGSPAIDTGSSVGAPAFDFDGNSRPRGAGYDIGVFEK